MKRKIQKNNNKIENKKRDYPIKQVPLETFVLTF